MENKNVRDTRMYSLLVLYEMHTDYFLRALDAIDDKDAQNRLNTQANHIGWIAGSMVEERFELAKTLGIDRVSKAHDLFKDHKGIQADVTYPTLDSYKKDWLEISPLLKEALRNLEPDLLDSSFEMMPDVRMTYFDFIAFVTYREANCIGQIALWRRLLGYKPMNYM
jgi:hypothetical protein